MDMETRRKMASDNRITEESSIESSVELRSSCDMLTSADLGTSLESEEASIDTSESVAGSLCHASPSKLSSEDSSSGLTKDQKRTQEFFETQAKMSELLGGNLSPSKSMREADVPLVMVHSSRGVSVGQTGFAVTAKPKKQVRKKKKLLQQQEFDLVEPTDSELKKEPSNLSIKKSDEALTPEPTERNETRMVHKNDNSVKNKQSVKSPFRTSSEQDLLRATAIIKENLTNIVENYLVQAKPRNASISPSKAAIDKTVRNYKRFSQDLSDIMSINSINSATLPLLNSKKDEPCPRIIPDSGDKTAADEIGEAGLRTPDVDEKEEVVLHTPSPSAANYLATNVSSEDELSQNIDCNQSNHIDKSLQYKTKVIPQEDEALGHAPIAGDSHGKIVRETKCVADEASGSSRITQPIAAAVSYYDTRKGIKNVRFTEVCSKNLDDRDNDVILCIIPSHEKLVQEQHAILSKLSSEEQDAQDDMLSRMPMNDQSALESKSALCQQVDQGNIEQFEDQIDNKKSISLVTVLDLSTSDILPSDYDSSLTQAVGNETVEEANTKQYQDDTEQLDAEALRKNDAFQQVDQKNDMADVNVNAFSKQDHERGIQVESFKQEDSLIMAVGLQVDETEDDVVKSLHYDEASIPEKPELSEHTSRQGPWGPQEPLNDPWNGNQKCASLGDNFGASRSSQPKLMKLDSLEESFDFNMVDSGISPDVSEMMSNSVASVHSQPAESNSLSELQKQPFSTPINGMPCHRTRSETKKVQNNEPARFAYEENVRTNELMVLSPESIEDPTEMSGYVPAHIKNFIEHPSIDIIDEAGISCPYDDSKESVIVTLEDIVAKIDKRALANKLGTQLSDLASEGSFESLPYNSLLSQSGSFNDETDPPPVAITFHSYQHYETGRRLVRQKSSGSEDIPESDSPSPLTPGSEDSTGLPTVEEETPLDKFGMVDINIIVAEGTKNKSTGAATQEDSYEKSDEDNNHDDAAAAGCSISSEVLVTETNSEQGVAGLTVTSVTGGCSSGDSALNRSPVSDREDDKIDGKAEALEDSALETSIDTSSNLLENTLTNKSLPSPVDSVPESGFSSLKETFAPDQNLSEDSPDMTLSKSKDSLDLTDNERFPGTDTLSDDIETLSYNTGAGVSNFGSRAVSVEGSFRGSASDITSLDSSSNGGLAQLQSCGTSRDLPDLDLDSLVIPNSHIEKALYRQLALQSSLVMQESRDVTIPYQEPLHKESPSENESITEKSASARSEKFGSEEGSCAGIKTSDSISSEDTILSKISMDEQNKLSTDEQSNRVSSDEHSKVSLEEASRLSSTDHSKLSMDDTSKLSSTDQSKFSMDEDFRCSIDSQFLSLDDPSFGPVLVGQTSLSKIDSQAFILEEAENPLTPIAVEIAALNNFDVETIARLRGQTVGNNDDNADTVTTAQPIEFDAGIKRSSLQVDDTQTKRTLETDDEKTERTIVDSPLISTTQSSQRGAIFGSDAKSLDEDMLEALTSMVKDTMPHLRQKHASKKALSTITPFPSMDVTDDPMAGRSLSLLQGLVGKFDENSSKNLFAEIVEESEEGMEAPMLTTRSVGDVASGITETPSPRLKSTRPKSHDVHKKRKKRSTRREMTSQEEFNNMSSRTSSSSLKSHKVSSKNSKSSLNSEIDGKSESPQMAGSAKHTADVRPETSRPSLVNFTSSSGSTQDDESTVPKSVKMRKTPLSKTQSGVSNFGSASSSIHSDDSNVHFESASLRSDGSLDKFPHFDAVRAQVKPRTPKRKRQSANVEEKKESKIEFMHRSVTLPVGSLLSKKENVEKKSDKKEEQTKEKDEIKHKKKKKDKDPEKSEKKSAISSIKGLLKRNKSKEKVKESSAEKTEKAEKTSPSIFRRLERMAKSQSPSPQPEDKIKSTASTPSSNAPSIRSVMDSFTKVSPTFDRRPETETGDQSVPPEPTASTKRKKPGTGVEMGVTAAVIRTSSGSSTRSSSGVAAHPNYQPMSDDSGSNSSQNSPVSVRHCTNGQPSVSPRKSSALSPKLYRRVLTRNISSSQESIEATGGPSPQPSAQVSPRKRPETAASFHSLQGVRELMGSPAPVMGTRALNHNSVSVTIGFKPQVVNRNRTMSEGTHLNTDQETTLPTVTSPHDTESSNTPSPTKLGKRSSSMEILVCGKIREHCPDQGSSGGGFSREGSFRLHREISVETLEEIPEGSPSKIYPHENYQDYLNRVQASRDSQQSSTWSLCEIDERSTINQFTPYDSESVVQTLPRPGRSSTPSSRHSVPYSSHHPHSKYGKKMSLPHNLYLSERVATPDGGSGTDSEGGVGGSNPNLQRSSSPFTRNMPHSSSFTSSPYRRPHSVTGAGNAAAASPLRKGLCTSSAAAGRTPLDSTSPAPPLEELWEETESAQSSVRPEPVSLPSYLLGNTAAGTKDDGAGDDSDAEESVEDTAPRRRHEEHVSPRPSGPLQGQEGIRSDTHGVQEEVKGGGAGNNAGAGDDGDDYCNRPPNILVYAANNEDYFEAIKKTLLGCFRKDRYAVYHLSSERAFRSPWLGSASLLVICGDVQAHISTVFIRYLLNGGRVLSICSDFLNVAVPLFGTVEVAASEVVGVRYGRWGSVQFLHHQHCSHSSPHNNRFSTNLEQGDRPGSAPKHGSGRKGGGTVSVEPTHVEIKDTDGRSHCLELRVLATDDTWGAPSLIGAKIRGGPGLGVFSQVHLERGPSTPTGHGPDGNPPGSPLTSDALRRSATARREILRDLLRTELKLDALEDEDCCDEDVQEEHEDSKPRYTPGLLMGDKMLKDELLTRLRPKLLGGRELHRPQLRLVFVGKGLRGEEGGLGAADEEATEDVLPVMVDAEAVPNGAFDKETYFQNLSTTSLGRLLLYCEVLCSSARVLDGATPLLHGLTVVPRTQTKGLGRGGNVWLSPPGCLMFSLQLLLPLSSFMGSHLPLLQHIVSLAMVRAIARLCPGLQLQLKWPNDIYMGEHKLGGVLVTASHGGTGSACVNVGVGLNLTNDAPTRSVQQLLERQHRDSSDTIPRLQPELVLAATLNQLEHLLALVENKGPEPVLQMYYSCWKHGNAKVTVSQPEDVALRTTGRSSRAVTITGIDYYGFLKGVDCATGEAVSVHPDGNSFNMLEGLVYTKVS